MGACVSSYGTAEEAAIVIAAHRDGEGELRKYSQPIKAEDVLKEYQGCFVCSLESLQVDMPVRALQQSQLLRPGEVYFLLPQRKLQFKLTHTDMASVLYKATTALKNHRIFSSTADCYSSQSSEERDRNRYEEVGRGGKRKFSKRARAWSSGSVFSPRKKSQWVSSLETIAETA